MSVRRPFLFLILLFGVAVPIWLFSAKFGVMTSLRIPTSDLVLAFTPMLVALLLTGAIQGWRAAISLFVRAFDIASLFQSRWIVLAVLIPPFIYGLAFAALFMLGSVEVMPGLNLPRLVALFALFVVLAAGEEIGWMGYAFEPLQNRWGALGASLVLAVPWWLGHLPSMAAIGATRIDMAWWLLGAVGLRVIMTWLYNRTHSCLFAIVLFHALLNLSRVAIFPADGAHYLTRYQAAADIVIAGLAIAIVVATRTRLGFTGRVTV